MQWKHGDKAVCIAASKVKEPTGNPVVGTVYLVDRVALYRPTGAIALHINALPTVKDNGWNAILFRKVVPRGDREKNRRAKYLHNSQRKESPGKISAQRKKCWHRCQRNHAMKTRSTSTLAAVAPATQCSPYRVWRRRVKGWTMPENTVSVCRPGRFGNPFMVGPDRTQRQAVECFRVWLTTPQITAGIPEKKKAILDGLESLRGKNLACYCKPGTPCHADVLLDLANSQDRERPT